jgi:hypothetical protein
MLGHVPRRNSRCRSAGTERGESVHEHVGQYRTVGGIPPNRAVLSERRMRTIQFRLRLWVLFQKGLRDASASQSTVLRNPIGPLWWPCPARQETCADRCGSHALPGGTRNLFPVFSPVQACKANLLILYFSGFRLNPSLVCDDIELRTLLQSNFETQTSRLVIHQLVLNV